MHPNEDLINGYVEGTLGPAERADVERHLDGCGDCRQLAADLAEIRRVAGSLDLREPPARAWRRLERAIHVESHHAADAEAVETAGGRDRWKLIGFLAAAAVLIVATGVGLRYGAFSRPGSAPNAASSETAAGAESAASAQVVEAELRAAESHYDRAIKGLEQIASSEQGALDPKTAATLQKNLAVIDQAISESRAAVREQPTSEPAVNSLMENFKTKLALLQDTVALINEMRKGNEAGTAKIVSGLKQKGD
ncbi:MAG TPA: zf-HC2 domain-containing protein [Vicinamibacterales bacterium]|jgi:anti-sigma factor RsiW